MAAAAAGMQIASSQISLTVSPGGPNFISVFATIRGTTEAATYKLITALSDGSYVTPLSLPPACPGDRSGKRASPAAPRRQVLSPRGLPGGLGDRGLDNRGSAVAGHRPGRLECDCHVCAPFRRAGRTPAHCRNHERGRPSRAVLGGRARPSVATSVRSGVGLGKRQCKMGLRGCRRPWTAWEQMET